MLYKISNKCLQTFYTAKLKCYFFIMGCPQVSPKPLRGNGSQGAGLFAAIFFCAATLLIPLHGA